jgi:hypothetical protein
MLEKIILVHYVNVSGKSPQRSKEMLLQLLQFRQMLDAATTDEDKAQMISYVIPTQGETRVECVYPRYVSVEMKEEGTEFFLEDEDEDEDEDEGQDLEKADFELDESETEINEADNSISAFTRKFGSYTHVDPYTGEGFNRPSLASLSAELSYSEKQAVAKASMEHVLEKYMFELNTAETREKIRRDILNVLGEVPSEIAELTEKLASVREQKNICIRAQQYEPAARARDAEKRILTEIERVQSTQLIPYTNVLVELNGDYPHSVMAVIVNHDMPVIRITFGE